MSAPRIKIDIDAPPGLPPFVWFCTAGPASSPACGGGETYTIAAAADAGRAHLAAHHTAQMPKLPPMDIRELAGMADPEPVNGRENAAQPFGDDFPCCNPIQRTYDESRSDS